MLKLLAIALFLIVWMTTVLYISLDFAEDMPTLPGVVLWFLVFAGVLFTAVQTLKRLTEGGDQP